MKLMRLGIAGRMRVGKTTVAQYLATKHDFYVTAFAEPIKEFAATVGWDGQKDERGRQLLQDIGTVVRKYNEKFWIERLLTSLSHDRHTVVDDMRMLLEHQELARVGFRTLLVVKDPSLIRDAHAATTNHVTEKEVDKITPWWIITNNGSFDELYRQIDRMVAEYQAAEETLGLQTLKAVV